MARAGRVREKVLVDAEPGSRAEVFNVRPRGRFKTSGGEPRRADVDIRIVPPEQSVDVETWDEMVQTIKASEAVK